MVDNCPAEQPGISMASNAIWYRCVYSETDEFPKAR